MGTDRHFFKSSVFAVAAFFALAASSSYAQEAVNEEKVQQIRLTPDIVKRYVEAFQDIQKWQKSNETTASTDEGEDEDATENPLSPVQTDQNSEQMKTLLKKHGFDDLDVWTQTVQSVTFAYEYIRPEGGLADMQANIQKSIDDIKNDSELSEDQKKESIQNLETEFKSVSDIKPLPGNVDAVKPFAADIKKMTETE